ncbi:hypothetical protein [Streptomyces sp. TRM68416]|uniref:hypothetical protein n=1 Tax=Streptomyces sp. TRM68416 TaxID=2758412 RepID=UPI001661C78F|nr:hypothetical protein [Streptomyces sp. TRM68416]MBD0844754.1 hypothetical protein [Streptomyces sp. TRM68416]
MFGASVHGGSSHPVLLAAGGDDQKASGRTGTVLDVSGASPSSATRGEHMAFFEPAYKINVLRDRPFQQTA